MTGETVITRVQLGGSIAGVFSLRALWLILIDFLYLQIIVYVEYLYIYCLAIAWARAYAFPRSA